MDKNNMQESDWQEILTRARNLFMSGFNCSQSVVAAFAPYYGLDEKLLLRLSASFGGGIGRMRETCGAAMGMFMLCGLESGSTVGEDQDQKKRNYQQVQKLAEEYRNANGSLICREILRMAGCQNAISTTLDTTPDARTEEYYKKRPCIRKVESACLIYINFLRAQKHLE